MTAKGRGNTGKVRRVACKMGPIPTHNIGRYGIQSRHQSPFNAGVFSVVPREHEHTRNLFRLTGRLWRRQRRRRKRTGPTGDQSLQRRRRHRFLSFLDRLPCTLLPSFPSFVPFLIPATTDDDDVVGDPSRLACRPIPPSLPWLDSFPAVGRNGQMDAKYANRGIERPNTVS